MLVMNTPDANTISTAEQTLALMLALARHVPRADAHVREGKWSRKEFTGTQLAGKTLGIFGMGRVGRAVALRALAFEMRVLAYDPFFSGDSALDGRVQMAGSPDDVFRQSDYISLHTVMNDSTRNMINRESIAKMKDQVRIINCSRGGVINEADLAEALASGRVAGAALDVYSAEPPKDNPLLKAPNVVLAPHLGASTEEAQLAVTVDAVDALLAYLVKEEIRWAVNVAGMPSQLSDRDKSYLDLARRMGTIMSQLCTGGGIQSVSVLTHGESLASLGRTIQKQFLLDLLSPHFTARLNLINAESSAQSRGIKLECSNDMAVSTVTDSVLVRVAARDSVQEIVGEVSADGLPRIMAISGYQMNLVPDGEMVLIFNDDQPGVIGVVGTIFGDHKVNIADMMLSRQKDTALMVLKLDAPIPQPAMDALQQRKPPIIKVLPVTLPPLG